MSQSHDVVFNGLAVLNGKHMALDLNDDQLALLLTIEEKLPGILAEAVKQQIVVTPPELKRLVNMKVRPSLEASDDDLKANGEIIKALLAFLEKILPLILPLFVKAK